MRVVKKNAYSVMCNRSINTKMEAKLYKSKSLSSLNSEESPMPIHVQTITSYYNKKLVYNETSSDSSVEVYVVNDSDGEEKRGDSGLEPGWWQDEITVLENKLDRLSELFQEQCQLLSAIKEDMRIPKSLAQSDCRINSCTEIQELKPSVHEVTDDETACVDDSERDKRGRSLLEAIEMKNGRFESLDRAVHDALTEYLNSKELQEQLVTKTASVVRDSVASWVSRDLSTRYVPELERHSRRLMRNVTKMLDDAFADLKETTFSSTKQDYKSLYNIRRSLHRHRQLIDHDTASSRNQLPNAIETILKQELVDWRQKVLSLFGIPPQAPSPEIVPEPPLDEYVPSSPPQPADPEVSIIDLLLESAMITKHISDGDINASFVRALSASDLSLVMCACRAADPDLVFGKPCKLEPEVMLSLMQQLATDMVHETQLKCLYLESCITSFDTSSRCARAHLPEVAACVSQHLSRFLTAYPSHLAARRVTIILMAIGHLTN